jgi:hypothetical protein
MFLIRRRNEMKRLAILLLLLPMTANADLITSRADFESSLGTIIVDDYENALYQFLQSDAVMSAVLGETQYNTTGFSDNNIVFGDAGGNHYYCAGCNGSFLLDFTNTSVSGAGGVYGVGFDFFNRISPFYNGFVTYGDGSTENFAFDPVSIENVQFWGITSDFCSRSLSEITSELDQFLGSPS